MGNHNGKTLMVVGAGFGQLPAILTAKKMGLKVIAIDRNSDALGMKYADTALPVDVLDTDGAIETAKKYKINGIITMQTELPVPTIGAVVDKLGLNGVPFEVAKTCTDKIETRRRFAGKNIPQPDFRVVSTYQEAMDAAKEINFPCVTKPADNSGSRGITKVTNINGIKSAFNEAVKYSRKEKVLVEKFIEGIEAGAQCFSIDGHCERVLVHNDTMSRSSCMLPTGHSFPSMLDDKTLEEIQEAIAATVDALGIEVGPSNVDFILDKNLRPIILEVGARIGATCLPELVYYYTGIDWVKAAILASLGETPDLTVTQSTPCAALILEAPENGELAGYNIPDDVRKTDGLLEIEVTAKIGEAVNKLTKGTDRIGKIVVTDKSAKAAERKAERIKSQVTFDIR